MANFKKLNEKAFVHPFTVTRTVSYVTQFPLEPNRFANYSHTLSLVVKRFHHCKPNSGYYLRRQQTEHTLCTRTMFSTRQGSPLPSPRASSVSSRKSYIEGVLALRKTLLISGTADTDVEAE
jgi:hypothetical protein